MAVIVAADGRELGLALLTLLTACTIIPWAFVMAWSLFRALVVGESEEE